MSSGTRLGYPCPRMAPSLISEPESTFARWLPPTAIVVLAAPCLFLAYLPMTDLPQHAAVMSILKNLGDPAFDFDAYYETTPDRSLYFFTYGIALAFAKIVPLEIAVRIVVFLSAIAYPLGVLAVLRATGRPGALALLSLPLMYSRTFFWGFANFNLALGMALIAVALLERGVRGVRGEVALAALCIALVLTHTYGIAILFGYACLWLVVGDRRALLARLPALSPLVLGALAWFLLGHDVEGRGGIRFLSLADRVRHFEDSLIGSYPNWSDEILVVAMLGAIAFFAARTFPWNRARWRELGRCERIFALYSGLNLALYFALPTHLPSWHHIHFRHALLAVAFLPLIAQAPDGPGARKAAIALLTTLTLLTFAIHWSHLIRFDREARGFDDVIAELPDTPKVYFLNWDQEGTVTETHAYHHFHAYIQARRGGLISFSFPELFWNIPVRVHENAGIPRLNVGSEWNARLFDYDEVGDLYDYMLVRKRADQRGVESLAKFPYERIYSNPPWELYRHLPDEGVE